MRKPKPGLQEQLLDAALAILIGQGQQNLSMRALAASCSVSATTIYYYWKDKEALIRALKLYCMEQLNTAVLQKLSQNGLSPLQLRQAGTNALEALRCGLEGFRDWAFANPDVALLVMSGFQAEPEAEPAIMERYYASNQLAEELLELAVRQGRAKSSDPRLDSSLCIAAVWGVIEAVLRFRTWPEYWDQGLELSNRAIAMNLYWLTRT